LKKFLVFLLIIFSVFFSSHLIYADNFSQTQDYADNKVFVTTILTIDQLPTDEIHQHYRVEYDVNEVQGLMSSGLGEGISWGNHLAIEGGRYRRKSGVNDYVALPPFSKFAVWAFIKNESGHEVTLRDWQVFSTYQYLEIDGWGMFGIESNLAHVNYKFFGIPAVKDGRSVFSPVIVDVADDEIKIAKLVSLDMNQPLDLQHFEWNPRIVENGDLVVDFLVKVKNIGNYNINSVNFVHKDFSLIRNFPVGNEYTYEYQVNYGKNYSSGVNLLESFRISKPTIMNRCAVFPLKDSTGLESRAKSLVYSRNDSGVGDWFGKSVDVDWYVRTGSMCVESIGYWLVGKELEFTPPMDVEVSFAEGERIVNINQDFVVNMKIKNTGFALSNISMDLNFDAAFQKVKENNCNVKTGQNGVIWEINSLNSGQELSCDVVFEVVDKNNFLKLENSLVFNNRVEDIVQIVFVPDLENSLEYDLLKDGFKFQTNVSKVLDVDSFEEIKEGLVCRKVKFFGLENEVCL
jgi:hypothetical protein